jgi:hypothetical protein
VQDAINLFLGKYHPSSERVALWDMDTDYYLHNPDAVGRHACVSKSGGDVVRAVASRWWSDSVRQFWASLRLTRALERRGADRWVSAP